MRPRARLLALVPLLLTGCLSSASLPGPGDGTGAVYAHPQTGEIRHCENLAWKPGFGRGFWASGVYADCKTSLEEQGFVRRR